MNGPGADASPRAMLKACCAAAYQQDVVALILGESYHPGGLDLTRRLARTLRLEPAQRVLDVASGRGATACLLAGEFGVDVDGIDLGNASVERARAAGAERGLSGRVRFQTADAERLPFADGVFDAVVCECALCTFPDKATAVAEFARVLRPGGRVGITDVTVDQARLDPQLATLAGYVACIADARPAAGYAALLDAAGLSVAVSEPHDEALAGMVDQIEGRLRAASLLGLPGVPDDLEAVLRVTSAASQAIADGVAGYHLIVAHKPGTAAPHNDKEILA
ncbi:MAG: methyltransferase domain-containing protein [Actinomycetota bacterium]|nr:methyltransferase domain-containing protein [Actinomycetota bacterium]